MKAPFFQRIYHHYILAALSGFLFWCSWLPVDFPFALCVAFIPLLYIKDQNMMGSRYSTVVFFSFFIATLSTCSWVLVNGDYWYIVAIIWQAILMTLPFLLYYRIKKRFHQYIALLMLLSSWITYEYFSLNFTYNFPWLILGNVFANDPLYIQWYEYTGTQGGSAWILAVNILLYISIKSKRYVIVMTTLVTIVLPISLSILMYRNTIDEGQKIEVVLVQPNFDPHTEKFPDGKNYIPYEKQVSILTGLANERITNKTDVVVFPETAIVQGVWKENIETVIQHKELLALFNNFPQVNLLTGIEIYEPAHYDAKSIRIPTRHHPSIGYHELYNSTLLIHPKKGFAYQHKSKAIPVLEKIPFINYKPVNELCTSLAVDKGIKTSNYSKPLKLDKDIAIAPIICYESIFGKYVSEFVKKGANIIMITSNDGWWGESAGYKQHFSYTRLRAIENRKSVVRCANTGISGFINTRGDVLSSTVGYQRTSLKHTISLNEEKTFYCLWGDYVGVLCTGLSAIILLLSFFINQSNPINT